jgi:hypothetical protein
MNAAGSDEAGGRISSHMATAGLPSLRHAVPDRIVRDAFVLVVLKACRFGTLDDAERGWSPV